jgi:uroporphyrin-3 C-methyltransferase
MTQENENASPSAGKPASRPVPSTRQNLALLVAILAVLLAGWQWYETRQRLAANEQEMLNRLAQAAAASQEERGVQRQLREQIESLQGKLGAMEEKLGEYESQSATLQTLYENISRGREESILIEVEHAVTLAGQQLQLAGNVPAAILALQSADARLARLDQGRVLLLRKALAKDLERLNALPLVDLAGISLRLEQIVVGVDKLPLGSYGRPSEKAENVDEAEVPLPLWRRALGDLWREIRGLIRIQRFDRAEPPLLAPGQDYLLRENIKLRLLNARLALFAHDQATFRNELKVAGDTLGTYFDTRDKLVQADQAAIKQLLAGATEVQAPSLAETQSALRAVREGKEKK